MFETLLLEFSALVGFASLVSLVVNVLKVVGVVKDGTAPKWVAGINLVGLIAFIIARLVVPEFEFANLDTVLAQVAIAGSYILSYVLMILGSKVTYAIVKGLPAIGKSNSEY